MHCDRALEWLAAPESLSAEKKQQLDRHLEQCSNCAEVAAVVPQVAKLASAWEPEPVPRWSRLPMAGSYRRPWLRWLPALVTAAVVLVAVFGLEVRKLDGGWVVGFGTSIPIQSDAQTIDGAALQDWQNLVEASLIAMEERQNQRFARAMLDLQSNQEAHFRGLLETALNKQDLETRRNIQNLFADWRTSRDKELAQLVSNWNIRRNEDLQLIEAGLKHLSARQHRTNKSLVSLATYVDRKPSGP